MNKKKVWVTIAFDPETWDFENIVGVFFTEEAADEARGNRNWYQVFEANLNEQEA
jgi:hypothetical protein